MTNSEDIAAHIEELRRLLREVHGIRGRSLGQALGRSRRFLPRRIRKAGYRLAEVEPMLGNPKLEHMVDREALKAAYQTVARHLKSVDVADLRRGWLLGLAGAMAVNVIAVAVLFVIWMRWAGQL